MSPQIISQKDLVAFCNLLMSAEMKDSMLLIPLLFKPPNVRLGFTFPRWLILSDEPQVALILLMNTHLSKWNNVIYFLRSLVLSNCRLLRLKARVCFVPCGVNVGLNSLPTKYKSTSWLRERLSFISVTALWQFYIFTNFIFFWCFFVKLQRTAGYNLRWRKI